MSHAADTDVQVAARQAAADGAAPAEHDTHPLNPMDRVLLAVNHILDSWGYAGFQTEMFAWLAGRADTLALRSALARLSVRHPALTARLVRDAPDGPCWQYRPGAECRLEEVTLGSADPQAALDYAAQRLALRSNLTTSDPIRFHLVHRPDGRDLFLMQYNHVLMDNSAALPLLGEIDRLSRGELENGAGPIPPAPDLVAQHLRRFSRWRRLRAAFRTAFLRLYTLRGQAVTLPGSGSQSGGSMQYRFATRTVSSAELAVVEARLRRAANLPSLSMALLGAVFQALNKLRASEPAQNNRHFIVGLGVELGRRDKGQILFQTLASVVPVRARPEQLADGDNLAAVLAGELRDRLHREIDLGTVQLASMFQNWPRLTNWAVARLLRSGYSLWYAYFGTQDHSSTDFCGARIDDISYAASAWSPLGITLIANQSRGRLILHATYLPDLVPDSLASSFLDTIVAGLRDSTGQ